MASFTDVRNEVFERQQRREQYNVRVLGLNAYERHKQFMRDYQAHYGSGGVATGEQQVMPLKTDRDTLKETYRFIRSEEDDLERSWEQRLAKRYHDKLFKEYCIADMSRCEYFRACFEFCFIDIRILLCCMISFWCVSSSLLCVCQIQRESHWIEVED